IYRRRERLSSRATPPWIALGVRDVRVHKPGVTVVQQRIRCGSKKDCHSGFGSVTAARTLSGLAAGEVHGRHSTSNPGATATSAANRDPHSPHWFIRGGPHAAASGVRVIRQGATLLLKGVNPPRFREALCGPEAVRGQVGSASPDALDSTIVTPNRSRSSGRIALSGRGPGRRPAEFSGGAARGGAARRGG